MQVNVVNPAFFDEKPKKLTHYVKSPRNDTAANQKEREMDEVLKGPMKLSVEKNIKTTDAQCSIFSLITSGFYFKKNVKKNQPKLKA